MVFAYPSGGVRAGYSRLRFYVAAAPRGDRSQLPRFRDTTDGRGAGRYTENESALLGQLATNHMIPENHGAGGRIANIPDRANRRPRS